MSLYVDWIASGVYDFIRVPLFDQLFEVMNQMMYVDIYKPNGLWEAIVAQYIEDIFTEVPDMVYLEQPHLKKSSFWAGHKYMPGL